MQFNSVHLIANGPEKYFNLTQDDLDRVDFGRMFVNGKNSLKYAVNDMPPVVFFHYGRKWAFSLDSLYSAFALSYNVAEDYPGVDSTQYLPEGFEIIMVYQQPKDFTDINDGLLQASLHATGKSAEVVRRALTIAEAHKDDSCDGIDWQSLAWEVFGGQPTKGIFRGEYLSPLAEKYNI